MKLSCPFCGQHIKIEEAGCYQCPACNKVFEVEEEEETTATQAPEEMAQNPGNTLPPLPLQKMADNPVEKVTPCPYCTAPVSPAARKCLHCGEWLIKRKSKVIYFLLAMFLPTGLLGFAEWYIGRKKHAFFVSVTSIVFLFSSLLFYKSIIEKTSIIEVVVLSPMVLIVFLVVTFFVFISGLRHIKKINGKSLSHR